MCFERILDGFSYPNHGLGAKTRRYTAPWRPPVEAHFWLLGHFWQWESPRRKPPESQKCASTGGFQEGAYRRVLAPKAWLWYENSSKTLPEHKKQVYNAFLPLFFRLKNGHFGDFSHFWGQNRQKSGRPNFQALEKGATFHFLRLKIFFRKILAL